MATTDQLSTLNTQLKATLQAHPELAQLAQQIAGQAGPQRQLSVQKFKQGLQQNGVTIPDDIMWNESSQSFETPSGNWKIALPLIAAFTAGIAVPALVGALGMSAATGGAGAAASAAPAGVLPSTVIGSGAIGPIAGGASGAVPAAFAAGSTGVAGTTFGIPNSTLFGTGVNLFGSLFSAHEQSSASDKALQAQIDASKYSADLTAKSNADALAFQKAQAEAAYQSTEATQRANYGQAAARHASFNVTRKALGLPEAPYPDYVPSPDPYLNGGGPTAPATPGAPTGAPPPAAGPAGVDASKGDIAAQISAYFKSRGVSDQETPYWVQKWGEFGAKDPAYFNQRLSVADSFGGGGGTAPAAAPKSTGMAPARLPSVADYLAPPLPPTLTMPAPNQPQSVYQYLNG